MIVPGGSLLSGGVNRVILIGNLGRKPELSSTASGSTVAKFGVATSQGWKNHDTNEWEDRTEWHNCVCFGRQAEVAEKYLSQGSRVYVEGSLRTSNWERDGEEQSRTEVIVQHFLMLGGRESGNSNGWESRRKPPRNVRTDPGGLPGKGIWQGEEKDDEEDSIPF